MQARTEQTTGFTGKQGASRATRSLRQILVAAAFLLPALIILALMMVYPILYTAVRSTFDRSGEVFVGLQNYQTIVTEPRTLIALRNNIVWVAVVPMLVTSLGLIFAVLTDRVRAATAFKIALFMPLVVSGLAAGVIFRILFEGDPSRGLANAALQAAVHLVQPPGQYAGARPSTEVLVPMDDDWVSSVEFETGEIATFGLVAIRPQRVPESAQPAVEPQPVEDGIAGLIWLDFSPGGGNPGVVDPGEMGLPGVRVEAWSGDEVVARTTTDSQGRFLLGNLAPGDYQVRLAESSFRPPYEGIRWLAPALVTPSIIIAYIWIHTGFALIIITAGLKGINPELLEAGRVDGASEWQVFRYLTVPLLRPALVVVLVTTTISVLKIFDIVLVIPPETSQRAANVLALEMWRASFGGARDFGLGSALAIVLFLLITPAMIFNVRRFLRAD